MIRTLSLSLILSISTGSCKTKSSVDSSQVKLSTEHDTVTGIHDDATLFVNWIDVTPALLKDGADGEDKLEFYMGMSVCQSPEGSYKSVCERIKLGWGKYSDWVQVDNEFSQIAIADETKSYVKQPTQISFGTNGKAINRAAQKLPKANKEDYWITFDLFENDRLLTDTFVAWQWMQLKDLDKTLVPIRSKKWGTEATLQIVATEPFPSKEEALSLDRLNFMHVTVQQMLRLQQEELVCIIEKEVSDNCSTPSKERLRYYDPGKVAILMPFGSTQFVFQKVDEPGSVVYFKAVAQQPITLNPRAIAEYYVFDPTDHRNIELKKTALTIALHMIPGGRATDHFTQEGIYSGEAWISAAGDLGMAFMVAGNTAIRVTGMIIEGGVVTVRGYQMRQDLQDGNYIEAGAKGAEIALRVLNMSATVRAIRAGVPGLVLSKQAQELSENIIDQSAKVVKNIGDEAVPYLGKPGPGISDDILESAHKVAKELDHPIVLYGSRQAGISPKTGLPFRPDSDVDIAVVELAHFSSKICSRPWINQFHKSFEHGPSAIFSVKEAMANGYLVVLPK